MSAPHHYKQRGRFNLLDTSQYSEQVVLRTEHGTVSAMWPDGDCPYDDNTLPSEVADLIRSRLDGYLFMSDRDSKRAVCDAITANAAAVDSAWLLYQAKSNREQAARLIKQAKQMEREAADLTEAA